MRMKMIDEMKSTKYQELESKLNEIARDAESHGMVFASVLYESVMPDSTPINAHYTDNVIALVGPLKYLCRCVEGEFDALLAESGTEQL